MSARPLSFSVFLYLGLSFSFSDTKILVVAGEREKEKGNWAPKIVGGRGRERLAAKLHHITYPQRGESQEGVGGEGGRPLICFSCGGGGGGRRTRNVVIKRAKKTFPPLFFLGCVARERDRERKGEHASHVRRRIEMEGRR